MDRIDAQNGRNCRRIGAIACAVAAILTAPLLAASPAPAQSVIDQYRPAPRDSDDGGGGGAGIGREGELVAATVPGGDIGPAATTAAPGGGDDLPLTGYPLTSLIIALLILLLVGVTLRIAVEVRSRLNGQG